MGKRIQEKEDRSKGIMEQGIMIRRRQNSGDSSQKEKLEWWKIGVMEQRGARRKIHS
jgi:hypothetical protein